MITIRIYKFDLSEGVTTLSAPSYTNLKVGNKKMAISQATFDVDVYDPQISATTLKKYNRVKIYDDEQLVFNGYISSFRIQGGISNVVNVICKHVYGLFEKRLTGSNDNLTGNIGTNILNYLASANSAKNMGIVAGSNGVTATATLQFKRQTMFRAWLELANAGLVEFEIDDTDHLNVLNRIGEDKTAVLALRYDEDQPNLTNMIGFELASEGDDMTNYVVGMQASSTSIKQDTASQNEYGLLQKTESITAQGSSSDSLGTLTEKFLANNKDEKFLPNIELDTTKIDAYAIKIGDWVRVVAHKGTLVQRDENYVVNEINMDFVDSTNKKVRLVVAKIGTNNRLPNFSDDFKLLSERVSVIERQ